MNTTILNAIQSICFYDSAFELLEEETILPNLDPDFLDYLRTFDAFEGVRYACLNHDTVLYLDSVNGDLLGSLPLGDVLDSIREYYGEG